MTATTFDAVCVGNAIVDVLAEVDDAFVAELELDKGSMRLSRPTSPRRSTQSRHERGRAVRWIGRQHRGGAGHHWVATPRSSAGSPTTRSARASCTTSGSAGVAFDLAPAIDGPPTAHCLILVTPDGERTMNTYLGASQFLAAATSTSTLIASAAVTYLEGYLWDPPHAKDAFRVAMDAARRADRKVAFALSDAFCVDRYRDEFADLLAGPVDIVFGNDVEALSMFETEDLEAAITELGRLCEVVVITRGPDGSSIVTNGERVDVPAVPVEKVVDTTGAGDVVRGRLPLWATRTRFDPYQAASLAAPRASETISARLGARRRARPARACLV